MIKNFRTVISVAFGVAAIAFVSFACKKNERIKAHQEDRERILYVNLAEKAASSAAELFLGGNIQKVVSISYQHSILDILRSSPEWKTAIAGEIPEWESITRTYVFNSDASLVTIPLRAKGAVKDYFNVYIQDKKMLITRLSGIRDDEGLTTWKVQTPRRELYYQFDLNDKNQLGNWKFGSDMPKIFTDELPGVAGRTGEVCSKKKFYGCMNCLILDVCGSDWMCSIACGLAIPSCVGGAALVCLVS